MEWIILPYIDSVSCSIIILSRPKNRKALMPLSDKAKFIERPTDIFINLISEIVHNDFQCYKIQIGLRKQVKLVHYILVTSNYRKIPFK